MLSSIVEIVFVLILSRNPDRYAPKFDRLLKNAKPSFHQKI